MKYLAKQIIVLASFIMGKVLYYTQRWDETDWVIVLFCAFAFGCFSINNCTTRKRL